MAISFVSILLLIASIGEAQHDEGAKMPRGFLQKATKENTTFEKAESMSANIEGSLENKSQSLFLEKETGRGFGNDPSGYDDYWTLINDYDVAAELPYLNHNEGLPTCMQGLVWMDQQCTSWLQLPGLGMLPWQCFTLWGFSAENEFLTGFKSWDGKCVSFERKAWTFGKAEKAHDICYYDEIRFCQTNSDTHGPCDDGAYFTMDSGGFNLRKTSYGWDRASSILGLPFNLWHYPLLPIVDWQGQKTKWFHDYSAEVSRRHCPIYRLNCRLNQWASTRQTGNCLRASR